MVLQKFNKIKYINFSTMKLTKMKILYLIFFIDLFKKIITELCENKSCLECNSCLLLYFKSCKYKWQNGECKNLNRNFVKNNTEIFEECSDNLNEKINNELCGKLIHIFEWNKEFLQLEMIDKDRYDESNLYCKYNYEFYNYNNIIIIFFK